MHASDMRMARRCVCLSLVALLLGCSSGQTGSPDCIGSTSCVCEPLLSWGILLRVRVEQATEADLVAPVESVVSPAEVALDLAEGDHVGGVVAAWQPCASDAVVPAAGDELLVFYQPAADYPSCEAYQSCMAANCTGLPDEELADCWTTCENLTAETCTERRNTTLLDGTFAWAIPWTDPLPFGDERTLPRSELETLFDYPTCRERFPPDPAPPCDDVVEGQSCSMAPARSTSAQALSLLTALAWLGRRRRRASR